MIKYVAIGGIFAVALCCNIEALPLSRAVAFSVFETLVLLGLLKLVSYA